MSSIQRRLTAILSADVADYAGLMEADEAGTLERLKRNRVRVFDPRVAEHGGRIVKLMGDGALVEFGSVVAAVNCALAIQEATAREQADAGDKAIRYRIGINLGDVIVEGDDIYGEGVNVAARLQALAPIGGIALSAAVRDHVAGKAHCHFEDMGEHTVKSLQRPVHVYVVGSPGVVQVAKRKAEPRHGASVCVLPFTNMSGDPEQEYFSDGITEDIITDLSKVSALWVAARNTAFQYKGKQVDIAQVARQLKVGHILEGSVRKAGGRVRITAQLIDGATGGHVWAERYDRDLNDIFALQDEISQAIVSALRLKLLPEEKKAIEKRGTTNAEAYKLYLLARQYNLTGNIGDPRRSEAIIRLCQRATEIDPGYAHAWALMASAQGALRFHHARDNDGGLAAAERAIALDPELAEAHAAKAQVLARDSRLTEAPAEIDLALRLDPESYEVNAAAAMYYYTARQFPKAIRHYDKAATLAEKDYKSAGMIVSCYKATGDRAAALEAARRSLARAEKVIAQDPANGSALSFAVGALATLGETERAAELADRAMLLDPDNVNMQYNFVCMFIVDLRDYEGALDRLEPLIANVRRAEVLRWMRSDPDLDPVRENPRFKAMMAAAEARLANAS